ncbi:MAG: polysaccharide deacetylase family protein [Cyclobacteriaceae bacterium]
MEIFNYLFHRVSPIRDPLWDPMDTKLFDRCIRYISRNYQVVLLEDFVMRSEEGVSYKKPLATISFDDGYKDNIKNAVPILNKYDCKATFYVVTDCVEYNRLTWTHILEHAFQYTQHKTINLNFPFLPESLKIKDLATRSERFSYFRKLKSYLRSSPHEQRIIIVKRVMDSYDDVVYPSLMMDWSDLRELKNEGHYIGSHSVSHSVLSTIEDEAILKWEILQSGKAIEKELGYFPVSLSYPLGKYNQKVKELCQEAGYKMGVAVNQRPYNSKIHSDFDIPRMELYNEKWWKTWLRLNNYIQLIKRTLT